MPPQVAQSRLQKPVVLDLWFVRFLLTDCWAQAAIAEAASQHKKGHS